MKDYNIGLYFRKLKIISFAYYKHNNKYYKCLCECGNTKIISIGHIKQGKTQSCGCLKTKQNGLSTHPLHQVWYHMINRCTNPLRPEYINYGGRGITVCDEWLNSFTVFLEDIGERPSVKHSIERRNNELGYNKNNCYWATKEEQNNNTRSNVFLTHNGNTLTLAQWSRELGIPISTIITRRSRNWEVKDILQIGKVTRSK